MAGLTFLSEETDLEPYLASVREVLEPLPAEGSPLPVIRETSLEIARAAARFEFVLVVGEPGVGKSGAIAGLGRAQLEGDPRLPAGIRRLRVVRTDPAWLTQHCRYHMYLEGRIGEVHRLATKHNLLVYLQDLMRARTAGAHAADRRGSVLGLMSGYIGRGLRLLGAMTPAELDAFRAEEPKLAASAHVIRMEPASRDETEALLAEALPGLDVRLVRRVVSEADRLLLGRRLPGAAFEILKTASAVGKPSRARISIAVATITGLREEVVDEDTPLALAAVEERLRARVFGQPEAVAAAARAVIFVKTGLWIPGHPLSCILLLGPSGVGKSILATTVQEILFQQPLPGRFDMSEYLTPASMESLFGPGGLPDAVAAGPRVILLDEIEKASPEIIMALLPLLGEGRLSRSDGSVADFSGSVIVLTSNLLSDLYRPRSTSLLSSSRSVVDAGAALAALARRVPAEFLGRIDEVVAMRSLDRGVTRMIAERELSLLQMIPSLAEREIQVELAQRAWERLLEEGYRPDFGARPMQQAVRRLVAAPIASVLAGNPRLRRARLLVDRDGGVDVLRT